MAIVTGAIALGITAATSVYSAKQASKARKDQKKSLKKAEQDAKYAEAASKRSTESRRRSLVVQQANSGRAAQFSKQDKLG